jgi:hypothetical protein
MTSPTQQSMHYLRNLGWFVDITEHWIPLRDNLGRPMAKKGIRKDLFGFGDILGIHLGQRGATIFQVTSVGSISARRKKIMDNPVAVKWLQTGNHIIIHGWEERRGRIGVIEEVLTLPLPTQLQTLLH